MEKNEEISEGTYSTHYRMLDSRIGRWMSVDPAAAMYYSWNPYNLSMNNPITNSDPSGATVIYGGNAKDDVGKYINKTVALTQEMYDNATNGQRKKWDKKGIGIGDQVSNPTYNESFANKIDRLDKAEETYLITDEMALPNKMGYFVLDFDNNRFIIQYGGPEIHGDISYGGTKFNNLFEEVYHAWQFTKGRWYYENNNGNWEIRNLDASDELDAHLFAIKAGGITPFVISLPVGEDNHRFILPTHLQYLKNKDHASDEFLINYMIKGIDRDEKFPSLNGSHEGSSPLPGRYPSLSPVRTNNTNITVKQNDNTRKAYPYEE